MILNQTSNPNVFALAADRASNPELMKKCSKLLRTIRFLEVDGTIRDKLYERACDALFEAEANAFDKAAELQAAITTDELTAHDE